jgi:murein DD-endopeptidase MepM/ murein hydrolase activator NlpD
MSWWRTFVVFLVFPLVAHGLDVCLPTANDALLHPGKEADFFQPTVEGNVESGMYGCVRSHGHRFHEGIDIKCLQRDRHGEPIDPVHAVADGAVAFINKKPGLSNNGRYVVLRHRWDGIEVFTLYAHLRDVAEGLTIGQPVRKGQVIATLGHSTNTREGISRDRAHLHFEINFMFNTDFHIWYPKRDPKAPPFGNFNGLNLWGMDPAALFRAYAANPKSNGAPSAMNFAEYVARQPIAFTVLVGAKPFPWLTMHPEQIQRSNAAAPGNVVAYEIGSAWFGLPIAVWPRASSEISEAERRVLQRGLPVLHRVDEAAIDRNPCRDLVGRGQRGWRLTRDGQEWIELLTYTP